MFSLINSRNQINNGRLSASMNNIPWGVMTLEIVKGAPVVVFTNRRMCDYLQMPAETIIGEEAGDVFRSFGIDHNITPFALGHTTQYFDFDKQVQGRETWYRLHFIPYTSDGNYCLVVMQDTTDDKARDVQYAQAQRLESLGQLAGGVAHDFNNLLSIIDGYARLGKKGSDIENCFERIMQAVQRGAAITNHLLTFGSHKIVNDAVTDLGKLIKDQKPMLRQLVDASVNLAIKVEDDLFIDAPEDPICQILLNLCINSRDAMPEGGFLIVEAGRDEAEKIYMRVTDTGSGMPPDIKARIFDPFFTTKDQGKGTGLGLSMVYGLVKDMHGDIDVVSKVGEGTTMTIRIPASKNVPHEKTMTPEQEISLHGMTIMVAEDEPDLLAIMSRHLENIGLRVIRAANGNEALRLQEDYEGDIDFLLTDVVMPELNGVRLSEMFSAVRPDTKIIFMSGYPANGQMARVSLPRDAILLPKPVAYDSLCHALEQVSGNNGAAPSLKMSGGRWVNP